MAEAEAASVHAAVTAGRSALARAAWEEAREHFAAALAEHESPEAHEGASWAAWWLDDVAACLDARERAYRLYRTADDARGAARMALWLGDDHLEFHREHAVANGWFARAERLLDRAEPCPERGWLTVFRAHAALGEQDTIGARRLAAEARELA